MPIGSALPPVAPAMNVFVDSLFAPSNRDYLPMLIGLANLGSGLQMSNTVSGPYLSPWPGAFAVPMPPAAPPLAPLSDRVTLLQNAERTAMLTQWWTIWNPPGGGLPGVASDQALLAMIRDYIANPAAPAAGAAPGVNSYVMYVPQVAFDGMLGNQVKLRLIDYQAQPFFDPNAGGPGVGGWDQANVEAFFDLLSLGAHFVVIHAAPDLAGVALPAAPQSFFDAFASALGGNARAAKAHSHYTGARGLTNIGAAYTYPAGVNQETAPAPPAPCPYIVAFLVGRTAWSLLNTNSYNTFFQLEGWPATGLTGIGGRHGADFATHQATLWNISTYGASIYSEKRGTTIFLAPPGWNPHTQPGGTIMMPYVGANPRQAWLNTALVRA
ncbi:MAG TPA: hypothetical protein VMA37_15395 [Acetobacteraceae bacterium]|nr:hypothetical protein [Acetobacteraceae bacterium]